MQRRISQLPQLVPGAQQVADGNAKLATTVVPVLDKVNAAIPDLQQAIAESERRFNGSGRVLVRYSGTEPLLRIMVEGEQDSLIREEADRLARIVTAHLS